MQSCFRTRDWRGGVAVPALLEWSALTRNLGKPGFFAAQKMAPNIKLEI